MGSGVDRTYSSYIKLPYKSAVYINFFLVRNILTKERQKTLQFFGLNVNF